MGNIGDGVGKRLNMEIGEDDLQPVSSNESKTKFCLKVLTKDNKLHLEFSVLSSILAVSSARILNKFEGLWIIKIVNSSILFLQYLQRFFV
jgi:hypothetical protein